MTHAPLDGPDTTLAGIAHLGAILGPVIPWLVWLARKRDDAWVAREAAAATNFGMLVLAAFAGATVIRELVPLAAYLGTLGQLAVLFVAVVMSSQAFRSVRRGLPATYPYDIKVVKTP
jgi:uncharacterized Tic20 family protein